MMYADYDYYITEYLAGTKAVIPEADFLFWEKAARREIDLVTGNRISSLGAVPDLVKDCTCEIAELLYRASSLREESLKEGVAGVMTSYSNDGQSASFDTSHSVYTEDGKKKEIRRICRLYLGRAGLLYSGVVRYES